MILTGVATGLSIRELFFGGLLPGILVGLLMLVTTTLISAREKFPRYPRASAKEIFAAILKGVPAMIMVFIILGGILGGIFTPTEASVVAVLYGLVIGFLWRRFTWENLKKTFIDSAISSAVVMMVIATAGVLTWLLAYSRIPQALAVYLTSVIQSPTLLMVILGTAFLLAGTVLDVSPAVLLFGPILLPVVQALGVDPIFFGVIMVFGLAVGLFTPPVGTTMIISAYLSGDTVLSVARSCIPYLISMTVLLYVLIFFSDLVLLIPTVLFR
jgi:C4-dicarboxylate transporter DctM subunit